MGLHAVLMSVVIISMYTYLIVVTSENGMPHIGMLAVTSSIQIDVDPEVSDAEIDEHLCYSGPQLSDQAKWNLF